MVVRILKNRYLVLPGLQKTTFRRGRDSVHRVIFKCFSGALGVIFMVIVAFETGTGMKFIHFHSFEINRMLSTEKTRNRGHLIHDAGTPSQHDGAL